LERIEFRKGAISAEGIADAIPFWSPTELRRVVFDSHSLPQDTKDRADVVEALTSLPNSVTVELWAGLTVTAPDLQVVREVLFERVEAFRSATSVGITVQTLIKTVDLCRLELPTGVSKKHAIEILDRLSQTTRDVTLVLGGIPIRREDAAEVSALIKRDPDASTVDLFSIAAVVGDVHGHLDARSRGLIADVQGHKASRERLSPGV
jgi:hypothetical protein